MSVSDTTGLAKLAKGLQALRVELVATEGTRVFLHEIGVRARAAEDLTGIGSWFEGRIKTLHPGILGGILAPRTTKGETELRKRHLKKIDLVVVNLYPFERFARSEVGALLREDFIDIGGVTLLRAAAKNHKWVSVVSSPSDYASVLTELRRAHGRLSESTRLRLATKAFARTAAYDRRIARDLPGGRHHRVT